MVIINMALVLLITDMDIALKEDFHDQLGEDALIRVLKFGTPAELDSCISIGTHDGTNAHTSISVGDAATGTVSLKASRRRLRLGQRRGNVGAR